MKPPSLDSFLKSRARGQDPYQENRHRIAQVLLDRPHEQIKAFPRFLGERFFGFSSKQRLISLGLTERDWPILDSLRRHTNPSIEYNYLRLAIDYIKYTLHHVKHIYDIDRDVSRATICYSADDLLSSFQQIDAAGQHSLYAYKLYSALHSTTHSTIVEHFNRMNTSNWVRKSLLYPLMFYYINLPTALGLDQMLVHLFPEPTHNNIESDVAKYLLVGENSGEKSLAMKCYLGLICHPFDLSEFIIDHFEMTYAMGLSTPPEIAPLLDELCAFLPDTRLPRIRDLEKRQATMFSMTPARSQLATRLNLPPDGAQFLEQFFDLTVRQSTPAPPTTILLKALHQMRWQRYPTKDAFDTATIIAQRYDFSQGGRLVDYLLTSLYMVPRRRPEQECRDLIRGYFVFGVTSPFLYSSPRGPQALRRGMFPDTLSIRDIERSTTELIQEKESRDERSWMKAVHWHLRIAEQELRIAEWLGMVRSKLPIKANSRFLSGIDWTWVDSVLEKSRIRPFLGNPDGMYVLLMRVTEELQRESNPLRFSIERKARECGSLEGLLRWLAAEFGNVSIAFLRFFLSVETILKLRLCDYYTAAITERLGGLENLVRDFDFTPEYLTEKQLSLEQNYLTTALSLMSVGAHQFEISWDSLKIDAQDATETIFKTYIAFYNTRGTADILSSTHKAAAYQFSNGSVRIYEAENRDWPVIFLVCGIIDIFLSHPSYGIEAILSVRIRHDNFRREFAVAINGLRSTIVSHVSVFDVRFLVPEFESDVFLIVQQWIDRYMHTRRDGKSLALFDFLPEQGEIMAFIESFRSGEQFDVVCESVLAWIKARLDSQLSLACRLLTEELSPQLAEAVSERERVLIGAGEFSSDAVSRVATAIRSTLARRSDELLDWFQSPATARALPLTFWEIKLAVEERFRSEISSGKLRIDCAEESFGDRKVQPDQIRLAFDLWCEIVRNALKYSGHTTVCVRARAHLFEGVEGLVFSSLAQRGDRNDSWVEGHPYRSATDALFGEGKSGLRKVAYLAASLVHEPAEIGVYRRRYSFHVAVPLAKATEGGNGV